MFLVCWTVLKKETCLGSWSACGGDPAVALRPRNTVDYRLPTFRPPGSKLGHSIFHWKTKSDVVGWFDNFEKEDVSGNFERLRGWSRGCTPLQECCQLPPTYFWVTWQQTKAFLISMKNKKRFSGWFDNFEKGDVFWAVRALAGVIPRLHSTSGTLRTTAYQVLGHMAPNQGIHDFDEK